MKTEYPAFREDTGGEYALVCDLQAVYCMGNVSEMFSSMGSFTAAFGMDKLNFGSFMGFYVVISGNMLSKEEKEHTVEFLFAHPLNRGQMQSCKLSALASQLTAMHVIAGKPVVVKYYIKIRKALAE